MESVLRYLQENKIFYVATTEDGAPRVRPFGAVMAFEDHLYICMNNQKKVYEQLKKDPRVEICSFNGGTGWMRVSGVVNFDDREDAREAMLETMPDLRGMYRKDDGLFVVAWISEAVATFSDMQGEPYEVCFG